MEVYRVEAVGSEGVAEGKFLGSMTSQGIKSSYEVVVVDLKERKVEKQSQNMMA